MLAYLLIGLFSLLTEVLCIVAVDKINDRGTAWVVLCAMMIPGLYYVNSIFVVADHRAIIPALLGHGLGAFGTMSYLSRSDGS